MKATRGCLAIIGLLSINVMAGESSTWTEPLTGMSFVRVPGNCYQMGTHKPIPPKIDDFWKHLGFAGSLSADEIPRHKVCIGALWIAQNEVRWQDWHKVMGGTALPEKENLPAANMSWQEAHSFTEKLRELSPGKKPYRLPTEAEWEYACRGGDDMSKETPYTSEMIGAAWHNAPGLRLTEPKPVGELPPNKFGLNDMLGNVWEWVADAYEEKAYRQHALYDPLVAKVTQGKPDLRVIRGGSFRSEPVNMRCAKRGKYPVDQALPQIGLRLVFREVEAK